MKKTTIYKEITINEFHQGTFKVVQSSYQGDKLLNTYEKKIQLDFDSIDNNLCFRYSEYDFKKNEQSSDTKASKLNEMFMKVIYPIAIKFNIHSKNITTEIIKSKNQISSELDEIKKFFTDDYTSQYIKELEQTIKDPHEVSQKFGKTLSMSFLFKFFFNIQNSDYYTSSYQWITNANSINFELHNTVEENVNEEDKYLKIQQKGVSIDSRSLEEIYYTELEYDENQTPSDNPIDCEHDVEYSFDKEKYLLQKVEATFQNFVNEDIEKETFLLERII